MDELDLLKGGRPLPGKRSGSRFRFQAGPFGLGAGLVLGLLLVFGCGYRHFAGPLVPMGEEQQRPGTRVRDDGTVTFVQDRLEVGFKPMTDEELNRQFSSQSKGGVKSINPYTFGDWKDPETGTTPSRFTIFRLKVKNYTYPKMKIDPLKATLLSDNGRTYPSLGTLELGEYYYPYAIGYAGNAYSRLEERGDILKLTLYPGDMLFSGQEVEGYVVFPPLDPDVRRITLRLKDVILRFNALGEATETIDIGYLFRRDVGRFYVAKNTVILEGADKKETSQ